MEANVPGLARAFRVLRPDQRGHGAHPADALEGPITPLDLLVADTVAFLEQVAGGWRRSWATAPGGFLALAVAAAPPRPRAAPGRVRGTRSTTTRGRPGPRPRRGDHRVLHRVPRRGVPGRSRPLPGVRREDGPAAPQRTPAFTAADLAGYPHPALVVVGDADPEIPIEHTLALRDGLPGRAARGRPGCRPRRAGREDRALLTTCCWTSSRAEGACAAPPPGAPRPMDTTTERPGGDRPLDRRRGADRGRRRWLFSTRSVS